MKKLSGSRKVKLLSLILAVCLAVSGAVTLADRCRFDGRLWDTAYTALHLGKPAYTGGTRVVFVDVGQGDCTLIMSGGKSALIDSGPYSASDGLVEYLKSMGIRSIDYLVMTHPHEDHMGSFADVMEKIGADSLVMDSRAPAGETDLSAFIRMTETAHPTGAEIIPAFTGMSISVGEVELTVIGPAGDFPDNENNQSLILRVSAPPLTFLITGDAEKEAETALINRYGADLKADVLKAGHHGSKTSTGDALLDAVSPDYVVFSAGQGNSFGHPADEVLTRVHSRGCRILRTDYNGNISFEIAEGGAQVVTEH